MILFDDCRARWVRSTTKRMSEKEYLNAVLAGDFTTAERLFERSLHRPRPVWSSPSGDLAVVHRASIMDRVLTLAGSAIAEPAKGPWAAFFGGRAVLLGFDENVVVRATLSVEERRSLDESGLLGHGYHRERGANRVGIRLREPRRR